MFLFYKKMMKMINLQEIKKSKKSFWDFIKTTPLEYSKRLSGKYGAEIYLKREDKNSVRSYKIRWAFNLINSLSKKEKSKWVVCASAWNHAQWFAITCNKLKIKWTVFMPITTPKQKVYKTQQFWWDFIEIILVWDTFDEAFKKAKQFEKKTKAIFVHPFDDERIICWQATVWLEIFEKIKPDYIICPIWWWWIISWIISVAKYLSPKTKVLWVEPAWAPSMKESLKKWKNINLNEINIFIDWAAVKKVWEKTFKICKDYKLEVLTSPEDRVCSTILEYLKEDWMVIEPAWALATDALKDLKNVIKWKKIVLIISWSNFDFERLPEVKERSMKFEWLKRYFLVSFPQRPWALKKFLNCLWPEDDIARFEYMKKSNKDIAPVLLWIETKERNNFEKIVKSMKKMWFSYEDITDNELYFNFLV